MKKNKDGCYHTKALCKGEYCCFHNPSDHKMNKWPMNIRLDRGGMTERICDHGIGHPDPDSLNWIARQAAKYGDIPDSGVHGCDGCCLDDFGETTLPILVPYAFGSGGDSPKEKLLPSWLSITLKLAALGWLICLFLALKH